MDVFVQGEEQILNCNMPDIDDGLAYENHDDDAIPMIDETPSAVGINTNQLGIFFLVFNNFVFYSHPS